jgi:hypothetical protein
VKVQHALFVRHDAAQVLDKFGALLPAEVRALVLLLAQTVDRHTYEVIALQARIDALQKSTTTQDRNHGKDETRSR